MYQSLKESAFMMQDITIKQAGLSNMPVCVIDEIEALLNGNYSIKVVLKKHIDWCKILITNSSLFFV